MKRAILILFFATTAVPLYAQRCLDINILALMAHLEPPGNAAACYQACEKTKNDEGQVAISNYGAQDAQLDEIIKRNSQDFNTGSITSASTNIPNMPSTAQVNDYKALAAKMQNMTPEQRKAYATQMAQQMQSNNHSASVSESPATAKLVGQTFTTATATFRQLADELAAKMRQLKSEESTEIAAVKAPNTAQCPSVEKTGLPACSCVNGIEGKYWQQIVNIENRYNEQKTALLQSYLPRYKALVSAIESNISKLHYGDDVRTANYKRILFNAQSSAFASAFDVPIALIKDIRKTGADAYVNKVNCDAGVYRLDCQK
jgi:hypothetical protein